MWFASPAGWPPRIWAVGERKTGMGTEVERKVVEVEVGEMVVMTRGMNRTCSKADEFPACAGRPEGGVSGPGRSGDRERRPTGTGVCVAVVVVPGRGVLSEDRARDGFERFQRVDVVERRSREASFFRLEQPRVGDGDVLVRAHFSDDGQLLEGFRERALGVEEVEEGSDILAEVRDDRVGSARL